MTPQTIDEIKKKTVGKALEEIKGIDFSDAKIASIQIGIIMGKLENNLEHELYKELNLQKRFHKVISKKGEMKNEKK